VLNPITHAEAKPGYRLRVRFADGVEGEVSVLPLVGKGVFVAWEDREFFSRVAVDPESGTVTWPGGIDLAPDALYEKITGGSASSAPRQPS
jgi:hypothetical protein